MTIFNKYCPWKKELYFAFCPFKQQKCSTFLQKGKNEKEAQVNDFFLKNNKQTKNTKDDITTYIKDELKLNVLLLLYCFVLVPRDSSVPQNSTNLYG